MSAPVAPAVGLDAHGLSNLSPVHWNFGVASLVEDAIRRGEGAMADSGPLVCRTAPHTGRSPNDKFIVREASSEQHVWWGTANRALAPEPYERLHRDFLRHLGAQELYVQDGYAGADARYRLPIRVVTETAWHSLFARHLFIPGGGPGSLEGTRARVHRAACADVPGGPSAPRDEFSDRDCHSLRPAPGPHRGTAYAGEIKKSIFTVMNYVLPHRSVMPMHCSANCGVDGDTALFFGLSGTGKTTLSSDVDRSLIGDDEHGWSDAGIFNFEGGCYAKLIHLSAEAEPQIHATTRRFGTVLKNVVLDPTTRRLDLDDDSLTENTRGAYPLSFIDDFVASGQGAHPRHVVMLTADAFGVLPPVARLTPSAAMYHFLSGYTAKVAGTERGVTQPKATFSTCFGAPFMVWHPTVYAKLLGERIARHGSSVWLVNTGWTGGPSGVGSRMPIAYTRAMVRAVLSGALGEATYRQDRVFQLDVPTECPGVPPDVLVPRETWRHPADYDAQAARLAGMFAENFETFEADVAPEVVGAGPRRNAS